MRVRPVLPGAADLAPAGLRPGVVATARVPASSANLGPGYDSLGLALALHDTVDLRVLPGATGPGVDVSVSGHGAGSVPIDEEHLVVRAVRAAFDAAGVGRPRLRLRCRNDVPHGRGLGSSAAAVVAGLVAARACLAEPGFLDDGTLLELATRFEGHPDNAAAALLGGATISWRDSGGAPRAVRFEPHPDIEPVLLIPEDGLSTARARAMLPGSVTHDDAAFNAGRAALLVEALARRPDLLLDATDDRLHQPHRAPAMPQTAALVGRIRQHGAAAVVSGAGPSVLVLGVRGSAGPAISAALAELSAGAPAGWTVSRPGIDISGAYTTTEGE